MCANSVLHGAHARETGQLCKILPSKDRLDTDGPSSPSLSSPAFPEGSLVVSTSEDFSVDNEPPLVVDCRVNNLETCPKLLSGFSEVGVLQLLFRMVVFNPFPVKGRRRPIRVYYEVAASYRLQNEDKQGSAGVSTSALQIMFFQCMDSSNLISSSRSPRAMTKRLRPKTGTQVY